MMMLRMNIHIARCDRTNELQTENNIEQNFITCIKSLWSSESATLKEVTRAGSACQDMSQRLSKRMPSWSLL